MFLSDVQVEHLHTRLCLISLCPKPASDNIVTRGNVHTRLHLSSRRTSIGTALSSRIRNKRCKALCSTLFHSNLLHLSLIIFLQDARFSINASQLSTSISSYLRLIFKTFLNRLLVFFLWPFPFSYFAIKELFG